MAKSHKSIPDKPGVEKPVELQTCSSHGSEWRQPSNLWPAVMRKTIPWMESTVSQQKVNEATYPSASHYLDWLSCAEQSLQFLSSLNLWLREETDIKHKSMIHSYMKGYTGQAEGAARVPWSFREWSVLISFLCCTILFSLGDRGTENQCYWCLVSKWENEMHYRAARDYARTEDQGRDIV